MKGNYIFEYLNENEFRKLERSVKKYNMLAYKKLTFSYYPELRKGTFLGKEVSKNEKDKTVSYELQLPTDELFKKVHGPIVLHYTVYTEKNIIWNKEDLLKILRSISVLIRRWFRRYLKKVQC
mgnify:CR=1 FL=1